MGNWPGKALETYRVVPWPQPLPGSSLPAVVNYGPGGLSFGDMLPLRSLMQPVSFCRKEGKML